MSLNRGVAALIAVAVVGAGTVGGSIAYASSKGKPVPNVAVVSGSHWTQIAPPAGCYNDGQALKPADLIKCGTALKKLLTDETSLPTAIIPSAGANFGINVDQQVVEDHGWVARYSTGTLVQHTDRAYAGPLSAAQVLTVQDQQTGATSVSNAGPVLVQETDKTGKAIYGEWIFQLKVAD